MLNEITLHLQKSHMTAKEYYSHKIESLKKQEDVISNKINKLLDLYLESAITENVYTAKS